MGVLFLGAEYPDFDINGITGSGSWGTTYDTNTGFGFFDTAYARSAMNPQAGSYIASPLLNAASDLWLAWNEGNTVAPQNLVTQRAVILCSGGHADANDRIAVRLTQNTTNLNIVKYNGSSETTLATATAAWAATTRKRFDLHVVLGVSGSVELFINGVSQASYSGDLSFASSVDYIKIRPQYAGSVGSRYSEIIVHTEDTRHMRMQLRAVTGAGDNSGMTGAYTDIDEGPATGGTGIMFTLDGVSSDTAGQESDFTVTSLASGTWAVRAVKLNAMALKGASGPTLVQMGHRISGTTSVTDPVVGDKFFPPAKVYMEVNPVTGLRFTQSEISSAQMALKSAT